MRTITIVEGYNVMTNNGKVAYETLDVYEAFRIARRIRGFVEKTDIHGDLSFYYAENGNRIRSSVWE
jgi:hypothetical protein